MTPVRGTVVFAAGIEHGTGDARPDLPHRVRRAASRASNAVLRNRRHKDPAPAPMRLPLTVDAMDSFEPAEQGPVVVYGMGGVCAKASEGGIFSACIPAHRETAAGFGVAVDAGASFRH